MDEKSFALKKGDRLPLGDRIFRVVLSTERDRKNKNVPALRCFSLTPADKGCLSVDWERKTTPEESVARFGATYKMNKEEYKPYDNREIFALEVSFVSSLSDVEEIIYDPVYVHGRIKGRVANPAHSLIRFTEIFAKNNFNDPETILKMRDHAAERKITVNDEKVHELVKELRILSS